MKKIMLKKEKIMPIILALSIGCLLIGTFCYIANVGDCRVYVSEWRESVTKWSIIDNISDPFSFSAGFFWDLGLVLLITYIVYVYIDKRKNSESLNQKPMSFNKRMLIIGCTILVSIIILIVGLANDMMWLSGIGLLVGIVTGILLQNELRINTYQKMSDEKLISLYQEYAHKIQTALSVGGGLTGVGSTTATNKINSDIDSYREKGNLIGSILVERGYTVNFDLLNGKVTKGKSNSDLSKIIKGAVVGGIIAGDVGAVIGAAHAINKNNEKK